MNYRIHFVLIFYFQIVSSVTVDCNFATCGECISYANERCVWCSEPGIVGTRCKPATSLDESELWCNKSFILNPEIKPLQIKQNYEFNKKIDGNLVQFRPQHIYNEVRPGVTYTFSMEYKPALDCPIDIYYLMDVSYSMKPHIYTLREQAHAIYNQFNRANNVQLGLGSFVEKRALPYFDDKHHHGYVFENLISLTTELGQFSKVISKTEATGSNYDGQEAGLDALMQVMKCEKELGWRKDARKIIVLCTDSPYHSQGDGKMIGVIKPNDMKCHLEDNKYKDGLIMDYPSVSQINAVANEGGFIIIFAAVDRVMKDYTALAKQISGAAYASLEGDAVRIIKDAYETSTFKLNLNSNVPSFVELKLDPECRNHINSITDRAKCMGTQGDPTIKVTGHFVVKSCPTNDELNQEITISPVGLKDNLKINLAVNCKCDCEKSFEEKNSSHCNKQGDVQCGICKCHPNRYGKDCRCVGTSTDTTDIIKCVNTANNDTVPCSGHGACRCGNCECEKDFSGDFCEFDDNSCTRVATASGSEMCAGNGVCRQGKCNCKPHWSGDTCDCPDVNTDCIAPYSKEICSGNGKCECGKCICNGVEAKNDTYWGQFCDTCEDCAEKRCKELEDYAYCNYMNITKTTCDEKYNATADVYKTDINTPEWSMATRCKKELDDGSFVIFKYKYEGDRWTTRLVIGVQTTPELPSYAKIWISSASAIGLVLLIGLITLIIWKIMVDRYDKREYEKFEQDSKAKGFDVNLVVNPTYVPACQETSNPIYNGSNNRS